MKPKPDKLKAFSKTMRVIQSCKTHNQFDVACNVVRQYHKVYDDYFANLIQTRMLYEELEVQFKMIHYGVPNL